MISEHEDLQTPPRTSPDASLLAAHRRTVVDRLYATLDKLAVDARQRTLFELVRPIAHGRTNAPGFCPAIDLPLLSYACCGHVMEDAHALAVGTTILELAMDLLDRVWDGETEQTWPGLDPRTLEVTGCLLLGGVAPLVFARLPTSPARRLMLQRAVAAQTLRIGAGEFLDLETFGRSDVTLDEVRAATLGKTGERRALYAMAGAILGGGSTEVVRAYGEMALHYGYARQIASDLWDLFSAPKSRDVASGSRTWPIVWALATTSDGEHAQLLEQLAAARRDPAATDALRATLRAHGADVRAALEIELARQRSKQAFLRARPKAPAAATLEAMIDALATPRI